MADTGNSDGHPDGHSTGADNITDAKVIDLIKEAVKRGRGRPRKQPRKPTNDWEDLLIRRPNGELHSRSYHNVKLFLQNHPDFKDKFAYDEWRKTAVIKGPVKWNRVNYIPDAGRPFVDEDITGILELLETMGQAGFSPSTLADAVFAEAYRHKFNPLTDWLSSLKWDGRPRVDTWLTYYLGTPDSMYTKMIGAKYLIGAVARAVKPGCKMDNILILEGEQGRMKSTALKTLFGDEYFTDQLSDLGSKDCSIQMQGIWCIELPELTNLDRASARAIKEWLSRTVERFRPPYGRALREYPRQCVVAGTTNPGGNGYLKDSTGARRFWPAGTVQCDLEALANDREQIWAEAYARYQGNERWWLVGDEVKLAEIAQRDRYERDVWHDAVRQHLLGRSWTTVQLILEEFGVAKSDMNRRDQMRIADELTFLGWENKVARIGERTMRVYTPSAKSLIYAKELSDEERQQQLELEAGLQTAGWRPAAAQTEAQTGAQSGSADDVEL